ALAKCRVPPGACPPVGCENCALICTDVPPRGGRAGTTRTARALPPRRRAVPSAAPPWKRQPDLVAVDRGGRVHASRPVGGLLKPRRGLGVLGGPLGRRARLGSAPLVGTQVCERLSRGVPVEQRGGPPGEGEGLDRDARGGRV